MNTLQLSIEMVILPLSLSSTNNYAGIFDAGLLLAVLTYPPTPQFSTIFHLPTPYMRHSVILRAVLKASFKTS